MKYFGKIQDNKDLVTKEYVDTGLSGKQNTLTFDDAPTAGSSNPVKSSGIKKYVDEKVELMSILLPTAESGQYMIDESQFSSIIRLSSDTTPTTVTIQNEFGDVFDGESVIIENLTGGALTVQVDNNGYINGVAGGTITLSNNYDIVTLTNVQGSWNVRAIYNPYAANPAMNGSASPGTSAQFARGDHVHPTDTTRQAKITTSGVLIGDGSGGVTAKTLDTSSLTNDNNHVPTSGVVKSALNFVPETGNAGWHNSIYRGKYLGSSVTAAQYAAISAGTFDDLYIGDYWTINDVNWRIAHFDYWYNKGDTACTTHHVVIVPDELLATGVKMNNSNVATGGYTGSNFYTGNNSNTGRATARNKVTSAFGSAHILTHRMYLTNAATNGYPSGGVWKDASVELMNEINVYGCLVYTSVINGTAFPILYTIDNSQFALFAHDPSRMCIRSDWWLRAVASGASFAQVNYDGTAGHSYASNPHGVRPAFAIVA